MQSAGIAPLTNSKSGNGFPLQQFDRAHVPTLIAAWLCDFSRILAIILTAFDLRIRSLYVAESPAIFPIHQRAYSLISI